MTTLEGPLPARWVKSSHSNGDGGSCLEWDPAIAPSGVVPVRDSKLAASPTLRLPTPHWSSFVTHLKDGHFDLD